MFELFDDQAIKAIMLAKEESRLLGHNFVGTEQILLGLIAQNTGIAARALIALGVTLDDARREVRKIIGTGPGALADEIPFTPRAKSLFDHCVEEANRLG